MVLVHDTSSQCALQMNEVSLKYLLRLSSYRADGHDFVTDGQTDRPTDRQTDKQTDRRKGKTICLDHDPCRGGIITAICS